MHKLGDEHEPQSLGDGSDQLLLVEDQLLRGYAAHRQADQDECQDDPSYGFLHFSTSI
jgi:hypothetical protein